MRETGFGHFGMIPSRDGIAQFKPGNDMDELAKPRRRLPDTQRFLAIAIILLIACIVLMLLIRPSPLAPLA